MDVSGTNLTMIQGDSESLTVTRKDQKGNIIPFEEGDTVFMTVKSDPAQAEFIFQKAVTSFQEGRAIIEIQPEDTQNIKLQAYQYDIQLTTAAGRVTTLVKPSRLTIKMGITW